MIVEKFNRNLEKYSNYLIQLRLLRNAVTSLPSEKVLIYFAELDEQQKGFFTQDDIKNIWISETAEKEENMKHFMKRFFPFEKISYSILHNFFIHNEHSPDNLSSKESDIAELLKKIMTLQVQTATVESAVIQKMEFFIPMKYSRPTEEELSRYVICQQLTVDIKTVSQRLNLLQTNSEHLKRQQMGYSKTLASPSVSNLQDIMKRLQNRVNSFGGEWLPLKQDNDWRQSA